jgi:hypothetical protein
MTTMTNNHPTRRRRAVTLTEVLFAVTISALVAIPVMATMLYVIRTHATASDITLARLEADKVIERLKQDVRNTSRSIYNRQNWPQVRTEPATGIRRLTLFDSVLGNLITWSYNPATNFLTRRVERINGRATELLEERTYTTRFRNFTIDEERNSVVIVENPETGTLATVNYTGGVRIRTRVFLRMDPANSIFQEVDGNKDGSLENDAVGAALFGLPNRNDDPRWQYIINVRAAFRNY